MGLREIFFTLLSAALLIASFPPFNQSWCIWFALVPFLFVIYSSQENRYLSANVHYSPAFMYGLLLGLVFYGGTLYWLYNIFSAVSIVLIAIIATFIATFGLLLRWLCPEGWLGFTLIAASLWTIIEFFKSEGWWLKFSWMNLGYALHNQPIPLQAANLIGQYGLSFLIVIVNCLLLMIIINKQHRVKIAMLLLFLGAAIYIHHSDHLTTLGQDVDVLLVQRETRDTDLYAELSRFKTTKSDPRIIVWPEYAIPRFLIEENETFEKVRTLAKEEQSTLIIGSKERAPRKNERQDKVLADKGIPQDERDSMLHFYNTAYAVSPQGDIVGRVYKMNPIPFFMDGYAGEEYRPIFTAAGTLGVLICFDLDFSKVSRNLVKKGAHLLVVPTFDAFTWGKVQHLQHSAMSSMRAVENGRYLIRAASSGTSQIITPAGAIIDEIPSRDVGAIQGRVKLQVRNTIYTRYGYLFPWLCLVFLLGFIVFQNPHKS
jgi:apolipoprotein N-acyltransferase